MQTIYEFKMSVCKETVVEYMKIACGAIAGCAAMWWCAVIILSL
jgi:hypothetical protein